MTAPPSLEELLFFKSCEQWGCWLSKAEEEALARAMEARRAEMQGGSVRESVAHALGPWARKRHTICQAGPRHHRQSAREGFIMSSEDIEMTDAEFETLTDIGHAVAAALSEFDTDDHGIDTGIGGGDYEAFVTVGDLEYQVIVRPYARPSEDGKPWPLPQSEGEA